MSKSISIDQSHSIIQVLTNNVDWSILDGDVLQKKIIDSHKEAGKQFTAFLKNGGKVIVDNQRVISIDRSISFDPETIIGNGWLVEEQDERAIALTEINLSEVILESTLKKGEKSITGKEKLRRLKRKINYIYLDAGIFKTLWENQIFIPEKWKEKTNGNTTFIFFDGTIFQNPNGERYVLYLYWDETRSNCNWKWHLYGLERDYYAQDQSAVLVSSII